MTTAIGTLRQTEFSALDGAGIFLNSASIGPMPASALAVLQRANADRAAPIGWPMERLDRILGGGRKRAARLIGAAPGSIALMPNTTTGINIAAHALDMGAGDIVLTFDREFPTNVYPWLALGRHKGVLLERIPVTAEGWPDEERLHTRIADPKVRAVCVSLTQFSNGYTLDLAELSRLTRLHGVKLIVDAIQAVGQIPVDVRRTPVDFLACGAQKWLLSPWGTGFLYVRPELIDATYPTFAGWAAFQGTDDYSRLTSYNPEPWPDARRFELITLPLQDFEAMNASLDLLLSVGVDHIAAHIREISAPIHDWVAAGHGVLTSPVGARGSAILCVRPHGDVAATFQRLGAAGVTCSLREGSIRLSPHLCNTREEVERVAELLG
ncbi:MAG: aminotransferase class V-fold PLP-dependent enzyme [Gemmatimonadota bacterium]